MLTNCQELKLTAQDGRKRLTDAADAETMLRIVQSVPSPKTEPVKLWQTMSYGSNSLWFKNRLEM